MMVRAILVAYGLAAWMIVMEAADLPWWWTAIGGIPLGILGVTAIVRS